VHLLLFAVALQGNDLHPILKRRRNRIQHVGGTDEEHLRQVERNIQVVVPECVVLLRIERLEQRRRRVATEIPSQFVHFIEHDHGVVGFRPANALDDLAR
jgi:hypothetical protein